MISIEDLSKRYGSTTVVDRVSMQIERNSITVIVGTSGSGKSTLLRMINRLVEPSGGRVLIDGNDTTREPAHLLRRRIGYAIQGNGLFPHRTVGENIATVPRLLGWDPARRIQLRLSGPIEVAGGAEAAAVWQVLPRHTRATYATALPPGTMVTDPAALPPPLTDEAAAAVFTLLHISVTQLDWLRLTHGGQERARFTWAARDAHATWIAP